jgi:acyl-CoA synthetase (AMP-forming)/AMP-acid ligase II
MFISGGSKIYPREVEEVLLEHPGVREVSVLGQPAARAPILRSAPTRPFHQET